MFIYILDGNHEESAANDNNHVKTVMDTATTRHVICVTCECDILAAKPMLIQSVIRCAPACHDECKIARLIVMQPIMTCASVLVDHPFSSYH